MHNPASTALLSPREPHTTPCGRGCCCLDGGAGGESRRSPILAPLSPLPCPPGTRCCALTWPGVQDGGGGKDTECISPSSCALAGRSCGQERSGGCPHVPCFTRELVLSCGALPVGARLSRAAAALQPCPCCVPHRSGAVP